MKRILVVIVLMSATVFSGTVQAQEKLAKLMSETTPAERAEFQTKNMTELLSLEEDQRSKIYEINLKYAHRIEEAYQMGGGKLQRLRQMKEVSREKDSEIKRVLTKEQYATYTKRKDEMKNKMKERAKENRRNG